MKLVGERVRELRHARGWTQLDLAMKLRAANQRVQRIERGRENLTIHSLAALANAFDIEIGELFKRSEQRAQPRRVGRPRKVAAEGPRRKR